MKTGERERILYFYPDPMESVSALALTTVATISTNKMIKLWDGSTGECKRTLSSLYFKESCSMRHGP